MSKRVGRPTDNRKDIVIRARVDEETIEKLDKCTEALEFTRSEVIRKGIDQVYFNTFEKAYLAPEDSRKLAWVVNSLPHAIIEGLITERESEIIKFEVISIQNIQELTEGTRELIDKVIFKITNGKRDYSTLLKGDIENG